MSTLVAVSVETLAGCLVSLVLLLAESLGILRIIQVRASVSWKVEVL